MLYLERLGKGIEYDTEEDVGSPLEGVPRRHFVKEEPDVEEAEDRLKGGESALSEAGM